MDRDARIRHIYYRRNSLSRLAGYRRNLFQARHYRCRCEKYLFLPTILEAVTFEIKPRSAVNVIGVLEALSHRESVNKSYVAFHIGSDAFDHSDEAARIVALSQRHGVGLILVEDQNNYDTWDIRSEAQWTNPDPDRLDAFINGLREETNKEKLRRALR
jgi:hypothetical protein